MIRKKNIPVRSLPEECFQRIVVERISSDFFENDKGLNISHRHDYHIFVLQEKGTIHAEVDFEAYVNSEPGIMYQSPGQVHRALKAEDANVYMLAIYSDNINANYLAMLQYLTPLKPLTIDTTDLSVLKQAFDLCVHFFNQKKHTLYLTMLKDSCNAVVGLIISRYLRESKSLDLLSRFERVTKAFFSSLEEYFWTIKRPAQYAQKLNISIAYLNECVKNETGFSVSYHIQQRIILEAKRLLYHSEKSIKEISLALGYDDYAYFSRVFKKSTGVTAIGFRNGNRE